MTQQQGNLVGILMEELPEREERNFDPLPVGDYACVVVKCEYGPTKSGNGKKIDMEYQVVEGQYENRRVFDCLNVVNPNPVAQRIANQQVQDFQKACGKPILDTDDFLNEIVKLTLGIQPAAGEYKAKNTVKYIKKYVAGAPQAPKSAPQASADAAPWNS